MASLKDFQFTFILTAKRSSSEEWLVSGAAVSPNVITEKSQYLTIMDNLCPIFKLETEGYSIHRYQVKSSFSCFFPVNNKHSPVKITFPLRVKCLRKAIYKRYLSHSSVANCLWTTLPCFGFWNGFIKRASSCILKVGKRKKS